MRGKIAGSAPYIVLGLAFLMLVILNLFFHDHWLDSDMAAEMLFSKLLSEEGRLFASPEWYYSTEFRFLYTHWIMVPLFHVLRSWHVIRAVTNILSYALMLAAYYFMMKPFGTKRSIVVMTSVILLLPFSETMMTHMVMGNTYMFHVIIVFAFFGLFLRLVFPNSKRNLKLLWLVLYLALAVVCGVSGVRYLLALQCPLVLAAFLYLFRTPEFARLRRELKPSNLRAAVEPLFKCAAVKYLCWSLLGMAGSLAGYAVNVLYVSKKYVFQTYGATNFIAVYQGTFLERVQNALGSLLMLFGYIPDREVISLRGVVTILSFVMPAVLAYCAVRVFKGCCGQRFFACLFFWVSLGLNVFAFIFTDSTMVPRYYITTVVFALPVLAFYLEKEEIFFDRLAVSLLLGFCFLTASGKTLLSYLSVDKNASKRAVAEFLKEEYKFGYATYWNANIMAELTDGEVEFANVLDAKNLEYFKWSSPMKYYESGYPTGEVFLLLTVGEVYESAQAPAVTQGRRVYDDGSYVVFVYDSAEVLMSLAETEN